MSVDRARRIVDRATWGWSPAVDAEVRGLGWEAWLDAQLDPSTIDDSEVEAALAGYTTLDLAVSDLYELVTGGQVTRVIGEVSHNALVRMVSSRRQLQEVMVDFWRNHFNVLVLEAQLTIALETDHDRKVSRLDPLGRFADLLVADAQSPAMLVYLDNWLSASTSADGVNVNFSRETLELHTLGIVDGVQPYDEGDVLGLANVLAGFSIDRFEGTYLYRPSFHAPIAVSLLDGAWSTPGRSGAAGEQDGVDVLEFLAHRPETARHLAWKLCRRFVADDPPDGLVDELAQTYLDEDTAVAPVLRTLFTSDAFFDAEPKHRRGLEAVVASLRATGAEVDPDPVGLASGSLHTTSGALAQVGQPLYRYPAPDGYPDTGAEWLSSDSSLKRWQWNGLLGRGLIPGIGVDAAGLAGDPAPATAGALVDALVERLLGTVLAFPDPGFDDVTGAHPFYAEIAWMADAGISTGYADGTYRPGEPVTRQAMSAFLHRAAGAPPLDPPDDPTFTDVDADHPFAAEIEWMAAEGISTGYADGTYRPAANVSRAAMSAFLYRAAGEVAATPLPTADRDALVSLVGSDATPVTPLVRATALPDLVGLVLSTPTFQHR